MSQSLSITKSIYHKVYIHKIYLSQSLSIPKSIYTKYVLHSLWHHYVCTHTIEGEDADAFIETGFIHFNVFWELREHFRIEKLQLMQLTAKSHSCMHSILLCKAMNPRLTWCYGHEDFMGKMRNLAISAAQGRGFGPTVTDRMAEKYLIAMHFLMTDPKAWFWRV